MFLFLVGFMTKMIPADMIQKAGLSQSAAWSAPLLIFHMGTMINIKELIDEWRTVVMAIISMIVGIIAVFAVVPLVGKEAAVVSIPIINGGIIATQIMTGAAMEKGFQTVAALRYSCICYPKICWNSSCFIFWYERRKKSIRTI